MPSEEHQWWSAAMLAVSAGLGPDPTPLDRRTAWDDFLGHLPVPAGVEVEASQMAAVDVEWLRPEQSSAVVVLYLHGGGYSAGSLVTHRLFAARLASASAASVMNVGYRLAPEHPFPAALADARAAYAALLEVGVRPRDIVVGGDSAGGGLALCLLLSLKDAGLSLPAAAILLAPLVDVRTTEGPRRRCSTSTWRDMIRRTHMSRRCAVTWPVCHPCCCRRVRTSRSTAVVWSSSDWPGAPGSRWTSIRGPGSCTPGRSSPPMPRRHTRRFVASPLSCAGRCRLDIPAAGSPYLVLTIGRLKLSDLHNRVRSVGK